MTKPSETKYCEFDQCLRSSVTAGYCYIHKEPWHQEGLIEFLKDD